MYNSYEGKQSYEKDSNSYYKSKDSSIVKCNNFNINGLDFGALPPALNGIEADEAQAADEGEVGASSSGSGERNNNGYQHYDKDFRFVCIYNNNVEVPEDGTTPEPPSPPPCEVTVDTITGLENQPIGIAYDSKHERMYVSNGGFPSFSVSVIDTNTNTVLDTKPTTLEIDSIAVGDGPVDIAYYPINKRMYVTNFRDDTVSVIDTNTNTVIKSINTLGNEPNGIAYDEIHKTMYVANSDNKVSVIDTNTNTVVGSPITVEGRPGSLAYDIIHQSMYVVLHDGFVSVIDTNTNMVVGSPIQIGNNPFEIAYDTINKKMYVANNADGTVSVIDTNTNTVVGSPITVGGGATGIAYDEIHKRMYVTNGFDDTVSVINLC
jgi:YVTN family beta-propeller protein